MIYLATIRVKDPATDEIHSFSMPIEAESLSEAKMYCRIHHIPSEQLIPYTEESREFAFSVWMN